MSIRLLLSSTLLAACGSGSEVSAGDAPAVQGDRIAVGGTGVQLVPPADFVPAGVFPGFVHPDSRTSIMVTEVPGPLTAAIAGFESGSELMQRGITFFESEERNLGEHPGRLMRMTQTAQGVQVEKWMWAFGTQEKTALIMGTCFDDALLPVVRDSILTATWEPDRVFDVAEGLGFELAAVEGLVLWSRMGNSLAYTSDGQPDLEKEGKPSFTLGPAAGSGPIDDKRAFVEERARQLPLSALEIRTVEAIEIDGLEGLELVASAEHSETGERRLVYQVMLFEPDNYWLAVGLCATEHEEEYLPVSREASAGFERH